MQSTVLMIKVVIEYVGLFQQGIKRLRQEKHKKYGVMTTPVLVVDGVVKVSGKIPSVEEIKALLK